ncbi:MAG: type III secretion system translocon subunit SctE [Kiritimatiellae bacterium]|nr:type III secretion system translocon subunit SctE [Kiritimatiellia bacterium]
MSDMAIDPNAKIRIADPFGTAQQNVAGGSSDGKVKDKTQAIVRDVASLIQETITVTTSTPSQTRETTGASAKTGVPVLDDPEDLKAIQQDLERLVAFLQLDNDQRQSELARSRIDSLQSRIDKQHSDRLGKIDESIKAAKKAEEAAKASRILGWLGALFAVIAAVVVTVVTGGAAAAFAITGAALAVTQLVLSETGAADKIVDAMAKSMEKTFGLNKQDAKAWAAGIYSATFVVASLISAGAGIGLSASAAAKAAADAAKAATDVMSTTARVALFASQLANVALGIGGAVTGGITAKMNYDATNASADVNEVNRYIAIIQQMLEETEEELEQIMNQIQALFSQLVDIITSKTETGNLIVENMNQMI